MRALRPVVLTIVALSTLALSFGCTSPVPPTVTKPPRTSLKHNPLLFVQATRHQQQITESLHSAGLQLASSFADADYALEVRVGNGRGGGSCGGTSNVAYILREGTVVMVIKGRGETGSCTPNIFDEMSEKLASYL